MDIPPIRVTCVWQPRSGQLVPDPFTWGERVAAMVGLKEPPQVLAATFARLAHYTCLITPPEEISRPKRRELAKRLENYTDWQVAVAVSHGELALKGPALVVCDADSTLFTCEVIEKIAAYAGCEVEVARITSAAMRGELDFSSSLRQRVATLAGLDAQVLDEVRKHVHFSDGAREMVDAFHRSGARVGVVSGGFMEVVEPLANEIGLDHIHANQFEIVDGKLTGKVVGDIVTGEVKERKLKEWAAADGIPLDLCVAVGDGANDLLMTAAAGLGVAYCAKPALADEADARIPFPNLAAAADLSGPTSTQILRP